MSFRKEDISDKLRQAALFDVAQQMREKDLNNCAKVRCMVDDMNRTKEKLRGVIQLRREDNQPPPDVDQ